MPRFSIIVGVYNQAATLPRLIESLIRQTNPDFEVHFCDDGSSDEGPDIIQTFISAAPSGRYFYHRQENKGMRLARNLNQGIKAARGEYCVLVMADSMLELDYLEVLNSYVALDRIVCGIRVQIDEVGGKLEGVDIDWRVKKHLVPEFASVIIAMPWLCLTGNGLTVPTEAFRRHGGLLERLEGYGGEDNELIARLFFKGYMCWSVPELRLYHRWHPGKESTISNSNIVADLIAQYER